MSDALPRCERAIEIAVRESLGEEKATAQPAHIAEPKIDRADLGFGGEHYETFDRADSMLRQYYRVSHSKEVGTKKTGTTPDESKSLAAVSFEPTLLTH